MINSSSCLVAMLSHYTPLSDHDRKQLATLEKSERSFGAGTEVYQSGDECRELFVVKKGWAFSYTDLSDGRRQIVRIHHPGDIVGFADVAMRHRSTTLRSIEEICLCPFPKSALDTVFNEAPRLSALLLSIALRDQVCFIDLLQAMGRMSAKERLSYMLLDLLARLRITNHTMTDTLRMPMNQSQIADHLGLTNVYVSKTLIQMEDEGLILRRDTHLQILNEKKMVALTDFHNRYAEMDTSWFPRL